MALESALKPQEKDPQFEGLVNFVLEKFGNEESVIRRSIAFEEKTKGEKSEYKLRVLNEALRRVTLGKLPELQRKMREEAAEMRG